MYCNCLSHGSTVYFQNKANDQYNTVLSKDFYRIVTLTLKHLNAGTYLTCTLSWHLSSSKGQIQYSTHR